MDKFLDIIIGDYETFHQIIEELQEENKRLKKQLEEASKRPAQQTTGTTNFDILKRLSNLEKHVFGSKLVRLIMTITLLIDFIAIEFFVTYIYNNLVKVKLITFG